MPLKCTKHSYENNNNYNNSKRMLWNCSYMFVAPVYIHSTITMTLFFVHVAFHSNDIRLRFQVYKRTSPVHSTSIANCVLIHRDPYESSTSCSLVFQFSLAIHFGAADFVRSNLSFAVGFNWIEKQSVWIVRSYSLIVFFVSLQLIRIGDTGWSN